MHNLEQERLKTVKVFKQLLFNRDEELNDLINLASEICEVPIAMITLMDENDQWLVCKKGTTADQNTKENSFCKHLIDTTEVLVVPDALSDERFAKNPVVIGEHAVRFYAGAPLITSDGFHLGSLCVFDEKPKDISDKQRSMLATLSKQAMRLMELEITLKLNEQFINDIKLQKSKTEHSEQKLRAFFDSSNSCHILLDKKMVIHDYNKAAAKFIKNVHRKRILNGTSILDYTSDDFTTEFIRNFNIAVEGKRIDKEVLINYAAGQLIWWKITFRPVVNEHSNIIGVAYSAEDINENKQHIAEITAQNSSLLDIAYIQSHEYRRPVASIIGLMELIKSDDYNPNKECLLLMENAVHELDEKIKNVVDKTEETLNKSA